MKSQLLIRSSLGIILTIMSSFAIGGSVFIFYALHIKFDTFLEKILAGLYSIAGLACGCVILWMQKVSVYEDYICIMTSEKIKPEDIISINDLYGKFPLEIVSFRLKSGENTGFPLRVGNSDVLITTLLKMVLYHNPYVKISLSLRKRFLKDVPSNQINCPLEGRARLLTHRPAGCTQPR